MHSLDITTAKQTASDWLSHGVSGLRATVGALPFFASTAAVIAPTNGRDETHYYLVPTGEKEQFMLVERRRLPAGEPAVNDLPKVRIFHLPAMAALPLLEERLMGAITIPPDLTGTVEAGIAARLEAMGAQIDEKASSLTGGILLVAGVVAFVNPLVGAGIALKSLLPDVGGTLLRAGSEAVAGAVRSTGESIRARLAARTAKAEVARMRPEVVVDPVLRFVAAASAPGTTLDPVLEEAAQLGDWLRDADHRMTAAVVCDALGDRAGSLTHWTANTRARLAAFGK